MKHRLLWLVGVLVLGYAAWRATDIGIAIWVIGMGLILGGFEIFSRSRP